MAALVGLLRSVPGVRLLRRYERKWLRYDLVAGLVLTALLVPQGMAYAALAGLPPVNGLYASAIALFAYAMFGPSPNLVIGPDSALAPMTAAAVVPLLVKPGDPAEAVKLAGTLTILMGVICIAAGLARLGTITELLSKPVRIGYLNGLAIIVFTGQLPKLFGFSTTATTVAAQLRAFADGVRDGLVVPAAAVIGIMSLIIILACRRWLPAIPGVLVAVVGAIVVTAALDLTEHGVKVAGAVPRGLPTPALPLSSVHDMLNLVLPAAGIAFVALADTSTLSRSFTAKGEDPANPSAEIVALGAANVAVGLFRGFPVSASGGRSAVAQSSGARTQLTGVIGAAAIVVVLLVANGLLTNLPLAALAAIIISGSIRLFDYQALAWMYRVRKSELLLTLAAMLGVVIFGVLQGIVVAVALSLAAFIRRAWRPYSAVLGRVTGERGWHDVERRPGAVQIPGLFLYRFDAPLFFANADYFARQVTTAVEVTQPPIRWVIVAAEPITDIDTSAADAIADLLDHLQRLGITLAFAELKGPPKDRLRRYGLYEQIGDERFYSTLTLAIDDYLTSTATPWVDWTKREEVPPDTPVST
jgi:high affinity sulfate transporter 1